MIVKELTVKRLRNVLHAEFIFDEKLVKISGDNGAGKSTIVDSIWLAIVGKTYIGKGRSAESLITKGETKAEIDVVLEGNGKKLKISRTITQAGNVSLDIRSSEGEKLQQKDLDLLLSEFTIDPLEFLRVSKKEQVEIIKNLIGIDTDEIDSKILELEEDRTNKNYIYTEFKKTVQNLGDVEFAESLDITDLLAENDKIIAHNQEQDTLAMEIKGKQDEVLARKERIENLKNQIKAEEELNSKQAQEILQMTGKKKPKQDNTELVAKIKRIEELNKKSNEWKQYESKKNELLNHETAFIKAKDLLEKTREERKQMITSAKMPIDGMYFDEKDGILVEDIALDQYSSAQQLVIACKIATFKSPELKVIYIKDGSLLDKNNLEKITELAEKEGYQIFVERVGEEIDSIVMREGEALSDKK